MRSDFSKTLTKSLPFLRNSITFVVLTLFVIILFHSTTQAQIICPDRGGLIQVTDVMDSADVNSPSINADGTRTVFDSDGDLLGTSGGNNQVYLYDSNTNQLTQITPASSSSANPSIDASGTLIAFESDMNIGGGNPDGNSEVFLLDTTTGVFTQITFTLGASIFGISISADGTHIAFNSNGNINGGNPEGNQEVYVYDITSSMFTQVTNDTIGLSITPSINSNGTLIAFRSDANINGGNPDGNREIYLYDSSTMTTTQITNTTSGDSANPSINYNGTRIAFESTANINGGNPDGNLEIYLYDTINNMFTQITSTPSGFNRDPSINADGTLIAFSSDGDFVANNPDGSDEIYVFDTSLGIYTQLTDGQDDSDNPAISADGTTVAFDSTANLTGDNPDAHCQLFIRTCIDSSAASNVPTLSEWGLIAMASILGIVGFMVARRRKAAA